MGQVSDPRIQPYTSSKAQEILTADRGGPYCPNSLVKPRDYLERESTRMHSLAQILGRDGMLGKVEGDKEREGIKHRRSLGRGDASRTQI